MAGKPKRGSTDYPAARLRKLVEATPLAREKGVALPEVQAPSLEGLAVEVPALGPVTGNELLARFAMLRREAAPRRDRALGEPLAPGDDVQLDVLGYCDGKLIPFSVRMGWWAPLVPSRDFPGLFEALPGTPLGDGLELELSLPADHPVEGLRGKPARFLVDVRAAREVTLHAEDDPELLLRLGRGQSLDEVMDALRAEVEQEREDLQWLAAQEAVLDALAARTRVELPRALVDDEVTRRWSAAEGQALEARRLTPDERHEALSAWLNDGPTRAEAERRLRISLALGAVARAEKLELTPARLEGLAAQVAAAHGVSAAEARAALSDSKAATEKMVHAAWHLLAVEHVLARAEVSFVAAAPD